MQPAPVEILSSKIPRAQLVQVLRAQSAELVEQLAERLAVALALVPLAIERVKGARLPKFQHPPRPRNPVGPLTVDQVSAHAGRGPRALPFIALGPSLRQISQKRVERRRRPLEKRNRVFQSLFHHPPRFRTTGILLSRRLWLKARSRNSRAS